MKSGSAYLLSELNQGGRESARLGAQARLFLSLEMPEFTRIIGDRSPVGDFGCGNGVITRALEEALPDSVVVGLDADPGAVELCRAASQGRPRLSFEAYAMGQGLACPEQGLGAAFTRLVLLHLREPLEALKDMAASLRSGGALYAVDCDDSRALFSPEAPWQAPLLDCMEALQAALGGTRRLGSRLPALLKQAGMQGVSSKTVRYSKRAIGHAEFTEVFLPVIGFYTGSAAKAGLVSPEKAGELYERSAEFMADEKTELSLAFTHAWGFKP